MIPEDDFGEESDSELEATDGNDSDFVPSSVRKSRSAKRKLILGSPMSVTTPPKKRKKCLPETFSPRSPDHTDKDDSDVNATEKSPVPRETNHIRFPELFKGSSNNYPGQPFDNCLASFVGTAAEKAVLAKKKSKSKI